MTEVTGWFNYRDIVTQQHANVWQTFKKLFENTKPKQILEIGTASGGLTLMLRDILDEISLNECKIRSYDVIDKHYLKEHIENGVQIDVRIKNLFNHQYNDLINDEIVEYIQRQGVTIVLCDGGSKKNEFNIISEFLKEGDIIMAHDYSPDVNYFNENIKDKIWNWLEISDSDIIDACNKHNLNPFMDDEFKQVVWVCRIKK